MLLRKINISAYCAEDDFVSSQQYANEHNRILQGFGLGPISSSTPDWINDPNCWVITARDYLTGEMLGGARVHLHQFEKQLPFVKGLSKIDPGVTQIISDSDVGKVAENCGLWVREDMRGTKLSRALLLGCIAFAQSMKLDHVYTLCSPVTTPMLHEAGFLTFPVVGDAGRFFYPTPDYLSELVILPDPMEMKYAQPSFSEELNELFTSGEMEFTSTKNDNGLKVNYDITVPVRELSMV